MSGLRSEGPTLARPIVYGLAALPLFDCVVDQLNNTFHISIGPLSLLQVINGPLLLFFLAALCWALLKDGSSIRYIPLPVTGALLMLGVACTEELVRTGSLSVASIGPYGQMLYWVLLWAVVAVFFRRREDANVLLRGLAAGAIGTAFSVFLGFVFGTKQYYGADAVVSSAGWFDTAKMITGLLITGGVILLYLGRNGHRMLCAFLAWFCFTACVLTYARAGWVAAGAVIVWLALWAGLASTRSRRHWLMPFLGLALLVGLVVPLTVGPEKLLSRWSDVGQGEQAGSGRATFWKMAYDQYLDAPYSRQVFGRGYEAMAEMLLREYGMDIRHTHNDLLDMLTVAGLCGAAWLLLLICTLFRQVVRSSLMSIEGAAGMAIWLTYVVHGQLTGQLWGTGVMTYYTISLVCLCTNASESYALSTSVPQRSLPATFAAEATP